MTTNYVGATDIMFGRIQATLSGQVAGILGYTPETRWPYVAEPEKPNGSKVWFRVSSQVVDEYQSTLSTCEGSPGQRKYETAGILIIEVYLPKSLREAGPKGRAIATALRDTFRNVASGEAGIRYYRARINDGIAPEELFYRLNVVTEFEYDEIK